MSNKVAVACPSFDILSPNDFYGVIRTVVIARNACLQQMRCHPPVGGLLKAAGEAKAAAEAKFQDSEMYAALNAPGVVTSTPLSFNQLKIEIAKKLHIEADDAVFAENKQALKDAYVAVFSKVCNSTKKTGELLNDSIEIGSLAWVVDRQALMQECPESKHMRKKRKINENEAFFLRIWPMLAGFILHGMRRRHGCHNGFIFKLMLRLTEGAPTHTSSGSLSRQQFIQAGVRRVFGEQLRGFMLKFVRGGLRHMQMTQPFISICILMSTLHVILAICSCLLHCRFEIIVECFIMLAHAGNNFAHF
jgi:hypothetical protein